MGTRSITGPRCCRRPSTRTTRVGFVWARQPGLRVTYTASPLLTFGISAEQAQTLTPSCSASTGGYCAINYLAGATGTLIRPLQRRGCAPGSGSVGGSSTITTSPTTYDNAPVTTYSYNEAPGPAGQGLIRPQECARRGVRHRARVFRNRDVPECKPADGQGGQTPCSPQAPALTTTRPWAAA